MINGQQNCNTSTTSTDLSKSSGGFFIAEPMLYKTKMCSRFVNTGFCPYEMKCMFAHGPSDLRTEDENRLAGLVTTERVRVFSKLRMIDAKAKARTTKPPSFSEATGAVLHKRTTNEPNTTTSHAPFSQPPRTVEPRSCDATSVQKSDSSNSVNTKASTLSTPASSPKVYQHQPYATVLSHDPIHDGEVESVGDYEEERPRDAVEEECDNEIVEYTISAASSINSGVPRQTSSCYLGLRSVGSSACVLLPHQSQHHSGMLQHQHTAPYQPQPQPQHQTRFPHAAQHIVNVDATAIVYPHIGQQQLYQQQHYLHQQQQQQQSIVRRVKSVPCCDSNRASPIYMSNTVI